MSEIVQFWHHLSRTRKIQYIIVLFLMVFSSLAEMVSIGAVIPFLGVLVSPGKVYEYDLIQPFIKFFEITNSEQLMLPIVIFFISVVVTSGCFRLGVLYFTTRLSYATGVDVSVDMYTRTMHQDYLIHINRNSSEVIAGIVEKTQHVIGGVVGPSLTFISSLFLSSGILIVLISINYKIVLYVLPALAVLYISLGLYHRRKLKRNSDLISKHSTLMIQSLQEGLGGIKDTILSGTQSYYCNRYYQSISLKHKANAENVFSAHSPKPMLEVVGIVCIAIFAYITSLEKGGIEAAIPMIGAITLGAQRLLPAMQSFYAAYTSIKGQRANFIDVLSFMSQEVPDQVAYTEVYKIPFEKEILLSNLNFKYPSADSCVLSNINIRLKKHTTIGFVGTTGSGKSTLINIIMGLLEPSQGHIAVDGTLITHKNKRSWQARIAHVPQNIFLCDGTIEENIALGTPIEEIDYSRVRIVAKKANILDLVANTKDGFQTNVGEQGLKISGGQRQRIGIARALYKNCEVLILDEATSALDNETEAEIMKEVSLLSSEMTILIIAHRLTTLDHCDQIIRI